MTTQTLERNKLKNVTAHFDGSYRPKEKRIGIGYTIDEEEYKEEYEDANNLNSDFSELLALMNVLEKLSNYHNSIIMIKGDCKNIIDSFYNNWKHGMKNKTANRYHIQFQYMYYLIEDIESNNNEVRMKWIPRENNTRCDKLSKNKIKCDKLISSKVKIQFHYKRYNTNQIYARLYKQSIENAKFSFNKFMSKENLRMENDHLVPICIQYKGFYIKY